MSKYSCLSLKEGDRTSFHVIALIFSFVVGKTLTVNSRVGYAQKENHHFPKFSRVFWVEEH